MHGGGAKTSTSTFFSSRSALAPTSASGPAAAGTRRLVCPGHHPYDPSLTQHRDVAACDSGASKRSACRGTHSSHFASHPTYDTRTADDRTDATTARLQIPWLSSTSTLRPASSACAEGSRSRRGAGLAGAASSLLGSGGGGERLVGGMLRWWDGKGW